MSIECLRSMRFVSLRVFGTFVTYFSDLVPYLIPEYYDFVDIAVKIINIVWEFKSSIVYYYMVANDLIVATRRIVMMRL